MSTDFGIHEPGTRRVFYFHATTFLFPSQVIINEENAQDTSDFITKRLSAIKNQRSTGELEDLALIIGMFLVDLLGRH